MARIARKTQLVFGGSLSAASNIAKFGSLRVGVPAFSLDPDEIQTTEYLNGWAAALTANKSPALQDLNALHYLHSLQLAYLMQQGIAEWDSATPYFAGSTVLAPDNSGRQFIALSDSTGIVVGTLAKWKPHGPSIPLGGVIATFPNLSGAYECTATTVPDDEGFVKCNGQTIADATSPMNGAEVPNINNDVFLMGNITSGVASVTGNTRDLNHAHVTALGAHTHNLTSAGGAKVKIVNEFGSEYALHCDYSGPSVGSGVDYLLSYFGTSTSLSAGAWATTAGLVGVTGPISLGVNVTSDSKLSSTQDIRPKYITAVHLMRAR
jgi:hypothetical protein